MMSYNLPALDTELCRGIRSVIEASAQSRADYINSTCILPPSITGTTPIHWKYTIDMRVMMHYEHASFILSIKDIRRYR